MVLIIKGLIVGIGKIIPGVSGSMLAISLGIYEPLINSINNFFKNPEKHAKFLLKICIGIILSIVLFSKLILNCLNNYYLITIFFFLGLIIGSLEDIKVNTKKGDKIIVIISFFIVFILGTLSINNEIYITNNILNFFYFMFIGFIDAVTMVIPGISGTATLMMLGAYDKVIETFSNLFNPNMFLSNIKIIIPFIIGMSLGIIITVKIVDKLFKKHKNKTFSVIMGFTLSTIILMGIKGLKSFYTSSTFLIAILFLLLGIIITKKINHYFSND